jgi:hypothetical protein
MIGSKVTIQGLKARPELNGTEGVITAKQDSNGRYVVTLLASSTGDEMVALKPVNVRLHSTNKDSECKAENAKGTKQCKRCGKKDGEDGCKLLRCSVCLKGYWCGKVCQKKDWSMHKKKCVQKHCERIKKYDLPRLRIVAPPELTGYKRNVMILTAPWDLDEYPPGCGLWGTQRVNAVIANIKKYFVKEREVEERGESPTANEIRDVVTDVVLLLHHGGFKGLGRLDTRARTDFKEYDSVLASQSFVPKGWKLNPACFGDASPQEIAVWQKGIEDYRTDYGEREWQGT